MKKILGFIAAHRIVSIMVCLFIGIISTGAIYYHHYSDYDFSSMWLKKSVLSSQTVEVPALYRIHHVFVIVEENHDWSTILKSDDAPYIHSLLASGGSAQNYRNVPLSYGTLHPSNPNYILLEAGTISFPDHMFTSDNVPSTSNSTSSQNHLTSLLSKQGLTWKTYQEDISGNDCPINVNGKYAPKHNPFIYFQDVSGNLPGSNTATCISHIRPLSELSTDLASGNIASYSFITPNLIHDMHDGSIAQGDTWLSQTVATIQKSQTFQKDGVLFITWDESEGSPDNNEPIGMIVESPFAKENYVDAMPYTHASYLKTVEEIFHLSPLLGMAADPSTHDLASFFQ